MHPNLIPGHIRNEGEDERLKVLERLGHPFLALDAVAEVPVVLLDMRERRTDPVQARARPVCAQYPMR